MKLEKRNKNFFKKASYEEIFGVFYQQEIENRKVRIKIIDFLIDLFNSAYSVSRMKGKTKIKKEFSEKIDDFNKVNYSRDINIIRKTLINCFIISLETISELIGFNPDISEFINDEKLKEVYDFFSDEDFDEQLYQLIKYQVDNFK